MDASWFSDFCGDARNIDNSKTPYDNDHPRDRDDEDSDEDETYRYDTSTAAPEETREHDAMASADFCSPIVEKDGGIHDVMSDDLETYRDETTTVAPTETPRNVAAAAFCRPMVEKDGNIHDVMSDDVETYTEPQRSDENDDDDRDGGDDVDDAHYDDNSSRESLDLDMHEEKPTLAEQKPDFQDWSGAFHSSCDNFAPFDCPPIDTTLNDERREVAATSTFWRCIETAKYLCSMCLLIFSMVVVMAAIFSEQTTATADMGVPPIVAVIVFWFLIVWLGMMEGGQGCLVGLQPIPKSLYADTHRVSHATTTVAHKGDNLGRFIVGRQFLAVLVVFFINLMASAIEGVSVFDLTGIWTEIFLGSGVGVMLTTIIVGQLTAQVNAAHCMLDFINTYFMLFTAYVSLAIEASGVMHSVYLVQIFFAKITGTPIESSEPPKSTLQNTLFWLRVVFSLAVLTFSFAVTLEALFSGQTTMYEGVPEYVSVILLFVLMCFVGLMEGMQIALFAVVNLPDEEIQKHPMAAKSCELTFKGSNLQAFLIGRQICVTFCMFIVARITSCSVDFDAGEETIFGVSPGIQNFFNTGLLGAVITTIVGSLAWRIIASTFPVAFLSNPLVYLIIRLCLLLEMTGVCSAAWLLALIQKEIIVLRDDETYIGTPEARAAAIKRAAEACNDLELQEGTRGSGSSSD